MFVRANTRQWVNLAQAHVLAIEPDKYEPGRFAAFCDFPSGKRVLLRSFDTDTEAERHIEGILDVAFGEFE